jgi:hypothetical protein
MDFFSAIAEVGFPIAAACAAGYFVFMILRFILAGVVDSITELTGVITKLNRRVQTMNSEIIKIDVQVSAALGLPPDTVRMSRINDMARKD